MADLPSPPRSWPERFIYTVPRMPDGVFVGFIILLVFLMGAVFGMLLCPHPRVPPLLTFEQRFEGLDARLRALEQRQLQETIP
jgi:hypothetical protein